MRKFLWVAVMTCSAALAACGGFDAPQFASDQPLHSSNSGSGAAATCGDQTCGANEYCHIQCTCCGIPGGGTPSDVRECRPIPTGCSAKDLCGCAEIQQSGGTCDQANLSVDHPCA